MSKITRRDFLKIGATSTGATVLAGCQKARRWVILEPYVKPPEEQLTGEATWYTSTCRQCPAGCGIMVRVMNGRALKIEGNPENPLNQGKLCARGQAGLQILYNPDRLSGPAQQMTRGNRQYQSISWEEGINTLFQKVKAAGNGLAVWLDSTTSGHLYDIFQRFSNALGGSKPVVFDTFSGVTGYPLLTNNAQDLFGSATLPAYHLGMSDVVFSFGADFLGTWLSPVRYGVEFGNFRSQPLGKRGYLVQFEPRMSITGAKADRWVPIRPGSEGLIAQAILALIARNGIGPSERIARIQTLLDTTTINNLDLQSISEASDINLGELNQLANTFGTAERPIALPGSQITGQSNASESLTAIQALNFVSGAIETFGGFSITHQPPLPGLSRPNISSYQEVKDLIDQMNSGQIEVLLIHGANPAYSLPPNAGFLEAIQKVPFVVSFAPMIDETAVWADLVLPNHTYLESWGYQVVSPDFDRPIVGSQQPVVTPYFDTRPTGDVMLTIAQGIPATAKALPWMDEVAMLKETITQLPSGATGGSGTEVLWARFRQYGGWWPATNPAPTTTFSPPSTSIKVPSPQFQGGSDQYPYFLHLHLPVFLSDGRGANQPWLQGSPETMNTVSWQTIVEIHPDAAQALGLKDGDVVKVTSPYGEVEALVYTYPAIRPDTVAIPFGQGHTDYGRYARNMGSNPIQLVGDQAESSGNDLLWSSLRVKITPTNKRVDLAIFENKIGVTEGFINQAFPGE
jgi:anaerobic selenocysteine-containing dehydrogenase